LDYLDWEPDGPCDHPEYEVDILDYRCRCDHCAHSWPATSDQVLAEIERQREYCEWEERESRLQPWRDRWDYVKAFFRWPRCRKISDDDLPF
jgi:hypothetical protein